MRRKIRIILFIKIITFIILTWIYMCSIPESIFCKCLSNVCILREPIIIRSDRLLAIQEIKGESNKVELENNLSSNVDDSKLKKSAINVSLNKNIKKVSNKNSKRRKSGYNRTYIVNKRLLKISYIYNYIKSIDYSIKDVVLGHSEKSDNHNFNEVITKKTIEKMLCKDYILINSTPLSAKLSNTLFSIFEDINNDIAIKSVHFALVIIFTHKYSNSTYGMNKSLDSLIFLTLMITCLSQILYTLGEYMIRNKYENIILEKKREIKEKYEIKANEKKEIKQKKKEDKAEKKKQKIEKLKDLETYINEYNDRYAKRIGLGKMDCYCEKKIFDVIDRIDREGKSNYKYLKKNLLKKYGYSLIKACLFPLIGVIIPVINISGKLGDIIEIFQSKELYIVQSVVFILLSYMTLLFIIYIMIKIVKYEKLKEKKGIMNFKEYCTFCKDVFTK